MKVTVEQLYLIKINYNISINVKGLIMNIVSIEKVSIIIWSNMIKIDRTNAFKITKYAISDRKRKS